MKTWQRVTLTVAVSSVVFLLLFPFMGSDEQPPTHYSVFTNEVPSDNPLLAVGAAVAAAGLTWVLTGRSMRR